MVRFALQIAPRLEPPFEIERVPYLFNERLACNICQEQPAAPVSLGEVRTMMSTAVGHRQGMRCRRHVDGAKGVKPWPMQFYDRDVLCERAGCTAHGCTLVQVDIVELDPGVLLAYAHARGTRWLCAGHIMHKEGPWRR